jgi:NADH-quinone oxidoreductase subunit G
MDWAMPVAHTLLADASIWVQALAGVAAAVAAQKGVEAPVPGTVSDETRAIASSLLGGERKAILLGNAAAHHGKASQFAGIGKLDREPDRGVGRLFL